MKVIWLHQSASSQQEQEDGADIANHPISVALSNALAHADSRKVDKIVREVRRQQLWKRWSRLAAAAACLVGLCFLLPRLQEQGSDLRSSTNSITFLKKHIISCAVKKSRHAGHAAFVYPPSGKQATVGTTTPKIKWPVGISVPKNSPGRWTDRRSMHAEVAQGNPVISNVPPMVMAGENTLSKASSAVPMVASGNDAGRGINNYQPTIYAVDPQLGDVSKQTRTPQLATDEIYITDLEDLAGAVSEMSISSAGYTTVSKVTKHSPIYKVTKASSVGVDSMFRGIKGGFILRSTSPTLLSSTNGCEARKQMNFRQQAQEYMEECRKNN